MPHADLALILRPGFGLDYAQMREIKRISYLPFLPVNANAIFNSDDGGIFFEDSKNRKILVFQKRLHRYQGFSLNDTILPVRIAKKAGAKLIFLSNAAGGLRENQKPGRYMIIENHIIVEPVPSLSIEFDSEKVRKTVAPYDSEINMILEDCVKKVTGTSERGVYAQVYGPAFETWAEADYLKNKGADAVGMSTALESVWAYLNGIKVVALSLLTNIHNRQSYNKLTDDEVSESVKLSRNSFKNIMELFIDKVFNQWE